MKAEENYFRAVIPELPVNDVAKTLNYYDEVLGYRIEGRYEDIFGSAERQGHIYSESLTGKLPRAGVMCAWMKLTNYAAFQG